MSVKTAVPTASRSFPGGAISVAVEEGTGSDARGRLMGTLPSFAGGAR
jgi:hypothetical protein